MTFRYGFCIGFLSRQVPPHCTIDTFAGQRKSKVPRLREATDLRKRETLKALGSRGLSRDRYTV